MDKKNKLFIKSFFIVGIRIFLGIIFFTAGMSKLFNGMFPAVIGPIWFEQVLAQHGLGLYAKFIAFSQMIIGLLLLTGRFATLGAIMLFPMILNILMVTISLQWRGTPYVNLFLLCLNVLLLLSDYPKLKYIFIGKNEILPNVKLNRNIKTDGLWVLGLIFIIFSIFLNSLTYILPAYLFVFFAFCVFVSIYFFDKNKNLKKPS